MIGLAQISCCSPAVLRTVRELRRLVPYLTAGRPGRPREGMMLADPLRKPRVCSDCLTAAPSAP